MKNASYFRQSAREALKDKWGLAIVTGIVASLLGGSTYGGGGTVSFEISGLNTSIEGIFAQSDPEFWAVFGIIMAVGLAVGLVLGIAFFILGSIVVIGYAKFNLNLVDGENADIGNLFGYFKHWKNAVLANLLRTLYIFLWSLLCFIPGIIASYSYAMVPYIMADDPELTPSEACKKSKEMMNGYKFDLFTLTLSFIGWSILCSFTCGIGYVVLTPYMEAAVADFYREISGTRPVEEVNLELPVYTPEA